MDRVKGNDYMAINEKIVTGKKYRIWKDGIWNRLSMWTKASDVEMNDGKNAEQTIGDIKNSIGNLSDLPTEKKTSIVVAFIEAFNYITADRLSGYKFEKPMTQADYDKLTNRPAWSVYFIV